MLLYLCTSIPFSQTQKLFDLLGSIAYSLKRNFKNRLIHHVYISHSFQRHHFSRSIFTTATHLSGQPLRDSSAPPLPYCPVPPQTAPAQQEETKETPPWPVQPLQLLQQQTPTHSAHPCQAPGYPVGVPQPGTQQLQGERLSSGLSGSALTGASAFPSTFTEQA
ncbi:hypothetical protein AOLI_G00093610 [Acnodon oligacanthus]